MNGRKTAAALIFVMATTALPAIAEVNTARVRTDAIVVDRVAEASKRDLPADLLKRIVTEDIELLRGRRSDGTYEYASYERFESGRVADTFSIQPRADQMETVEREGTFIYRVILEVPERRLVVARNRPVWVERVDVEAVPQGSSQTSRQSFEVKAWMQPGDIRPIDLSDIAKHVTVRVVATADKKKGYGNITVALVQAKIVDAADSPWADAVASAKSLLRALDNHDIPSTRAMAQRMRDALGGSPAPAVTPVAAVAPGAAAPHPAEPSHATVDVSAARTVESPRTDEATRLEMQTELQLIEDLLTGSDAERREGLDRLHQLIRNLRVR